MENKEIIKKLRLIAKLSEIQDVNQFKVRAINNAIFSLERAGKKLDSCSREELEAIDGIGKSIAGQISQLIDSGTCDQLDELLAATPPGILEINNLPGLGAKKVRTLWKELGIEGIEDLRNKIESGELQEIKGFGKKTSRNIKEALDYYAEQKGQALYPVAAEVAESLLQTFKSEFPESRWEITGALRRKCQVVDKIEILGVRKKQKVLGWLKNTNGIELLPKESSPYILRAIITSTGLPLWIRLAEEESFDLEWFKTTGSTAHTEQVLAGNDGQSAGEQQIYTKAGMPFYPPELRENDTPADMEKEQIDKLVTTGDIRGILHAHSTYSDGRNSLEEMVSAAKEKGFEYLGITDHSKSSFFYANGLYENRIVQQHREIDRINAENPDFRIFKGIECDILTDGSLDYADEILESFDFLVCSVHSVMSMDADTATKRLLKAIENPFTTILGHMTGRLLLRRPGYPVHMEYILEACARNNVAIELNANPNRLDVDWHWLPRIMESGIKISINPDAHSVEGYDHIQYGVMQARKGRVPSPQNLTSLDAGALDHYFKSRKEKALSRA